MFIFKDNSSVSKYIFKRNKNRVWLFFKLGMQPSSKAMSLKLLVFVDLKLVKTVSHPFSIRSPMLNFYFSREIAVFKM